MDVTYNENADVNEENNFSMDLTANNKIDRTFLKIKKNI